MKIVAAVFTALAFCSASFAADQESAAGVYRTEVGIYSITIALLANGNYLARWDGCFGPNGTSAGSWMQSGKEVHLAPNKEEGPMIRGYLTVLLVREMDGRKALLRKEDENEAKSPFPYLYRQQKSNQSSDPTSGSVR